MRYTIGATLPDKNGKILDGIYTYSSWGLPKVLSLEYLKDKAKNAKNDIRLPVIYTLEDAKDYLEFLNKEYKNNFKERSKRTGNSRENYKFFLLKLDSLKFRALKFIDMKRKVYKTGFSNIHSYLVVPKN